MLIVNLRIFSPVIVVRMHIKSPFPAAWSLDFFVESIVVVVHFLMSTIFISFKVNREFST